MSLEIRIEYVKISELQGWPRNPKNHKLEELGRSVNRFGFVQLILIDERTGRIVAGHGRLETLKKMLDGGYKLPKGIKEQDGEWLAPVIRGISFNSDEEAEAFLLADNRLTEIGGWNEQELLSILKELEAKEALDGIGFNERDLAAIEQSLAADKQIGKKPEELIKTYEENTIKQIVLYFRWEEYREIVEKLHAIMTEKDINNHTEIFLFLLKFYESHRQRSNNIEAKVVLQNSEVLDENDRD